MKIVIADWDGGVSTEIDPHSRIEIGEGHNRITVSVRDGIVEVSGETRISVQPRTANVVWIEPKR